MIISKSKPNSLGAAIFCGGLIAGMLDAADGFMAYYFAAGFNPIQVSAIHCQQLLWSGCFSKGISGALVGLLAHFFIAFARRGRLRGSNPVSVHAKQGRGNVGPDLRRCGIHCYELCCTTARSRREITLVFASLGERGSRARFVRWLTDRLGSPTHYKSVQLQYSGGLWRGPQAVIDNLATKESLR